MNPPDEKMISGYNTLIVWCQVTQNLKLCYSQYYFLSLAFTSFYQNFHVSNKLHLTNVIGFFFLIKLPWIYLACYSVCVGGAVCVCACMHAYIYKIAVLFLDLNVKALNLIFWVFLFLFLRHKYASLSFSPWTPHLKFAKIITSDSLMTSLKCHTMVFASNCLLILPSKLQVMH